MVVSTMYGFLIAKIQLNIINAISSSDVYSGKSKLALAFTHQGGRFSRSRRVTRVSSATFPALFVVAVSSISSGGELKPVLLLLKKKAPMWSTHHVEWRRYQRM